MPPVRSPSPERDGYDVRVMEVLDRASASVEERFADQPRLAVEIYRAIGSIYDRLGIPREGLKDFRRAVEISKAAFSQDDPELLAAKMQLASALIRLDQVDEPESLIRDALAQAETGTGETSKLTLALLSSLGELLQKTRRYHEAEPILRRATETSRRVHGPGDEQSLHAANSLVACLMAQGKIAEAGPVLEETLSAARASHGETHQATLGMMNNYAALLIRLDKLSEAEAVYRDLLKAVRRALPPGSFNLGMTLGSLGICLAMQDRHDEAVDPLMEAVEILTATAGGEHHTTERVLSELYQALYDSNRSAEALVYHQDAVQARLRIAGPGETESVVRSITEWSIELGDHGVVAPNNHAIRTLLDEASAMADQAHPRTARYLENLGWALVHTGQPACGEIILVRARDMLEETQHADRQRLAERIAEASASQPIDADTNGLARVSVTNGDCARWLDEE